MKKVLTVLLTLVMAVCLVNINNNHIKAEESNPTDNYLCFTAEEAESTVWFINDGTNNPNIEVSTDGTNFTTWSAGGTNKKTLTNVGDKIYVRGNNPAGFSTSILNCTKFKMTGKISVSGNIMSLIDNGAGTATEIPCDYCFDYLFESCNSVVSADKLQLPATTLKNDCYMYMFYNCKNLTSIPDLPAKTLTTWCYSNMFAGCTKLSTTMKETTTPQGDFTEKYTIPSSGTVEGIPTLPQIPAGNMFNGITGFTASVDFIVGQQKTYYRKPAPEPAPQEQGDMPYDNTKGFYATISKGSASTLTAHIKNVTKDTDTVEVKEGDTTLTENTHYVIDPGSIKVVFQPSYLNSLKSGDTTLSIIVNSAMTFKVTITSEGSSPTPSPSEPVVKDESCEKVIGPTWHWNNDKGICEDYGVVGTSTR